MVGFLSLYLPNITASILGWALDKLTDTLVRQYVLYLKASENMKRLERTLLRVQVMLKDVEINDRSSQIWLEDLKEAACEAADLLDDIVIFASRRKADDELQSIPADTDQGRPSYSGLPTNKCNISDRMDKLESKLKDIANEIEYLSTSKLVGRTQLKMKERVATGSLICEAQVFGRDDAKKDIKKLLLPDSGSSSSENVFVIPIVGMAGIGKTTFAQFVYNDEDVCKHFRVRMWVSVGRELDVQKLTKSIIESFHHRALVLNDSQDSQGSNVESVSQRTIDFTERVIDFTDLDPLQATLARLLSNQNFLLVLDDVWSESYSDWDVLRAPLRVGAMGSRILVTTRSQVVSKMMLTTRSQIVSHTITPLPFCLSVLNPDDKDSMKLFKMRAFGDPDFVAHPNLEAIGNNIVRKCKGLPLALKTLGSLLSSTRDEDYWNNVLRNQIWDFSDEESDILPALRLSYEYLQTDLKQCFAYCAIFPKEHKFKKDKLVQLWIAEGFVQPKQGKEMDDVGTDYFNDLLNRSFFQNADDASGNPRYEMHDLIHDLATFVSNDEYFRMDGNSKKPSISKKVRHLSFLNQSDSKNLIGALKECPSLRTMLSLGRNKGIQFPTTQVPNFNKLKGLRVLDLSSTGITLVPSSIGSLEHLRCLDLSDTDITNLPENVKSLYSLQTLELRGCTKLVWLPKALSSLTTLQHLEVESRSMMTSMPADIGKLTRLKTLSGFLVSRETGCKIEELKGMCNLQTLSIVKLENVFSEGEARGAALNEKQYLRKLKLKWGDVSKDPDNVQRVLAGLRPHENIKELEVEVYGGKVFPSWMGDQCYSTIVKISLQNFPKCEDLPPLGQLPALKSLIISTMSALQHVDTNFSQPGGFPSLETLEFENLNVFNRWDVKKGDIPRLHQLKISNCRNLETLPIIEFLQSLGDLEISNCDKFQKLPHRAVPLKRLNVSSCSQLSSWCGIQGKSSLDAIEEVTINGVRQLHFSANATGATKQGQQLQNIQNP